MKSATVALVVAGMMGAGTVARGDQATSLQPGEYEVSIRLELPNVDAMDGATKLDSICVTAGDAGVRGLVVLSEHNPLRHCPVSNVRYNGPVLTFDIICPGGDAAAGSARYTLWTEAFDGAIAVKMGGKNMTMIERQSGRRVGRCK